MEKAQSYKEIPLLEIVPSPFNPRKNFEGKQFDELVESIRQKGVLQPILVRPMTTVGQVETAAPYELVAGERRYRAMCAIADANGGRENYLIPATVRDLSDDDAFDAMTIENLMRQDLTPFEEAEGFKIYLDKRGMDHLQEFADRVSKSPGYIRRHIAVFELPDFIIDAWRKEYLRIGHLEQLLRLKGDKKKLDSICKEIKRDFKQSEGDDDDDDTEPLTVDYVKRMVDRVSVSMSGALFDLAAAGCTSCGKNTDVQKALFDLDASTRCNDPECYSRKLRSWVKDHWKETAAYKKFKTCGGVFSRDTNIYYYQNNFKHAGKKLQDKCRTCDKYVTAFNNDGTVDAEMVCLGPGSCFNSTGKTQGDAVEKAKAKNKKEKEVHRAEQHGEYFREQFYAAELPQRLQTLDDKTKRAFLLMVALVKSNSDLKTLYREKLELKKSKNGDYFFPMAADELFSVVRQAQASKKKASEGLKLETLEALLHDAMIQVVMQPQYGPESRRMVADYIGIDLQTEWRLTEEYLQKKTTAEILDLMDRLGITTDKKAGDFLYEVLGGKRGKFDKCKKGELIRIILESGVDLAGKVPDEILK